MFLLATSHSHELASIAHAIAGLIVALTGFLQIILKKGGGAHAAIGFTYLGAWLIVLSTGFVIGAPIIAMFGFFGFYMAFTGWRFASRRRSKAKWGDKVSYIVGLVASAVTLGLSVLLLLDNSSMGWIGLILGLVFFATTMVDVIVFVFHKRIRKSSSSRKQWYLEHMTRMYISYIAAMTAFTVIQHPFFLDWMNWLLPSVIGTPLIVLARRKAAVTVTHR